MGSLAQEFPQVLLQVLHGDWGHGSCCPALWPLLGHTSVIWAGGTFRRMGGGLFLSTPIRPGFQFSPQLLTTCL